MQPGRTHAIHSPLGAPLRRRPPIARIAASDFREPPRHDEELDFRQLRHHTRNALQRVIAHVHQVPGLAESEAGRMLIERVERQVCLSASISDQLFGLRTVPGTLGDRLERLGRAVVALGADDAQEISLAVSVDDAIPRPLHDAMVRVANEMVANAVRHAFRARPRGLVRIEAGRSWPRSHDGGGRDSAWMRVIDDGAGPEPGSGAAGAGEGIGLMREIASPWRGEVSVRREGNLTVAELVCPLP